MNLLSLFLIILAVFAVANLNTTQSTLAGLSTSDSPFSDLKNMIGLQESNATAEPTTQVEGPCENIFTRMNNQYAKKLGNYACGIERLFRDTCNKFGRDPTSIAFWLMIGAVVALIFSRSGTELVSKLSSVVILLFLVWVVITFIGGV